MRNRHVNVNVMTIAWSIAKDAVIKFGGSSKEYLSESLKIAWNFVKREVTPSFKYFGDFKFPINFEYSFMEYEVFLDGMRDVLDGVEFYSYEDVLHKMAYIESYIEWFKYCLFDENTALLGKPRYLSDTYRKAKSSLRKLQEIKERHEGYVDVDLMELLN